MNAVENLYDFLKAADAALVIPAERLPLWASETLNAAGEKELTVCHSEEGPVLTLPDRRFTCRLLKFEDEAMPAQLAVTFHGVDSGKTLEAFTASGGWKIPEVFQFFLTGLEKLDTCHQMILSDNGRVVLENSFFTWLEPVVLLPGILELEQVCLQITKAGIFHENQVLGLFSVGGLQFTLAFRFFYDRRVSAELLPAGEEDTFPGFVDFMKWLTGESGAAKQLLSWVGEGELDAALEGAALTLDLDKLSLVDAEVRMKLTLFRIPFYAAFFWAGKRIQASLWKNTRLSLRNLLENIGVSCELPAYLKKLMDIDLSSCLLEVGLEEGDYHFTCGIEQDLALGNFSLRAIWLDIMHNAAGTAFSISGHLILHTQIPIGSIPLATELLPESFSYTFNRITIEYSEGAVTSAGFLLSYQHIIPSGQNPAPGKEKEHPAAPVFYGAVSERSGTEWSPIGKRFGPVWIDQVGFLFQDGRIAVQLNGGLQFHGAGLILKGVRLGYDLNTGRITGGLDGIDLFLDTDVYSLEGSMYCAKSAGEQGETRYDGAVRLRLSKWTVSGIASYTRTPDGRASLFVFISCSVPLGGIPAFQVTGVMGGLGLNRELALPGAAQLERFPLLQMDDGKKMDAVLNELTTQGPAEGQSWLRVKDGGNWFALGVRFRSFGLVEGKLLLCFLFGEEFQVALFGSAEMSLPKGRSKEKSYAYFKLFLSAVFNPKQGSLLIQAVLSKDSFLLSRDCHVTGGAAYGMWFGNHEHAGDFVLTVGGYHPAFQRPAHYPEVDRLQFQWQVSRTISAKGEAYLAVTPACLMAGGGIQFLFQQGDIKAWFEAFFDLWMNWHPFYFTASIRINIGVSVTLHLLVCKRTVTLSAGAELELWGPAIGGHAHIHLSIISFQVSFGAKRKDPEETLDWEGFQELLPDKELHHVRAEHGITEEQSGVWVCSTGQFIMALETEIPAGDIGVRPMGKNQVSSAWRAEITTPGGEKREVLPGQTGSFQTETLTANMPKALWGQAVGAADNDPETEESLLKDMTVGCRLDSTGGVHTVGERLILSKEELIRKFERRLPLTDTDENAGYIPKVTADSLTAVSEIADQQHQAAREQLSGELSAYYSGTGGSYAKLAVQLETQFSDSPMLCGI